MSALMLTSSVAISAGAVFLFLVMALDYIVQKRSKRKRSSLYTSETNQGYQELEVSKN
jgi:hypothetical protein